MFLSKRTMTLLVESGLPPEKLVEILQSLREDEEAARVSGNRPYAAPFEVTKPERVWVYVMAVDHPNDQLVKVGVSKHPNQRRWTLEQERELSLYVAHTVGPFDRGSALAIERAAHDALSSFRERGEWFLCGVERAIEAVTASVEGAIR